MRRRVLHVIQNLNYGGMERLLADIVRRLDPDEFEPHVMALTYLGRFAEGLDGVATLHLANPDTRVRWSMLHPGGLARQIRAIAPDVVHSHSGVWYKASRAARMAGVRRVIHTDHGRPSPDPWVARMIERSAARRTDVVVAVSDALAARMVATVLPRGCPVTVVHNGVDTALHAPGGDRLAARARLGLSADAPVLASVGRLEPIKGYDVMVAAFAALRAGWRDGEPPVLVVAGDGSARPAVESAATTLGVADGIRWLGWRDDISDLHAAGTIFTMSSRSEGTSVSLLEAMSAGLCPVVTDVGGNRAVLGMELAHRLVPSEQPLVLAAAWRDALLDRATRDADACRARERVIDAYGLDAMVEAYAALYRG
jgi:glycosyltransferase involved in cell wall biosynthesis